MAAAKSDEAKLAKETAKTALAKLAESKKLAAGDASLKAKVETLNAQVESSHSMQCQLFESCIGRLQA